MPNVLHCEGSPFKTYQGRMAGAQAAWAQGVVRDVPKATADYLTSTFPEHFELVAATAPAAPAAPEVNRAMKPPPKRRAAAKKPAAKKPAAKKPKPKPKAKA